MNEGLKDLLGSGRWHLLHPVPEGAVLPTLDSDVHHDGAGTPQSAGLTSSGGSAEDSRRDVSPDPATCGVLRLPLDGATVKNWYDRCHFDPEFNKTLNPEDCMSASSTKTVSSSLAHLHTVHDTVQSIEGKLYSSKIKAVATKNEAKMIHSGVKASFADIPMTLGAFSNMILKMIAYTPGAGGSRSMRTYVTMPAHFLSQWMRGVRIASSASLQLSEIGQEPFMDYAKISVNRHKSNQAGAAVSEVEADSSAVYSNTMEPELNWYFMMALLHFACPPAADGPNVWGVADASKTLGDALSSFVNALGGDEEFLRLLDCVDVEMLRSHSIRKGVLTHLVAQDEGVDFYALMKRCGHRINENIREYIYARGGGDANIARFVHTPPPPPPPTHTTPVGPASAGT